MASCTENLEDEKQMMENIRKIHKALIEGANIDDVFKLHIGEFENPKKINNADDFVASIEEIEKMDAMLRMKIAEERQAKLSRIQMEEESKDILSNLPCYENSNRIRVNLEEFMRLLNDPEKTGKDTSSLVRSIGTNEGGKDKEEEKEEKKDKKSPRQRVATNLNFVERNIQLAKCGRGNLSLTDEEKLRIENILGTIEDPTTEASKENEVSESKNEKFEVYGMDPETKAALDLIDQRLQELSKYKTRRKPPTKPESIDKKEAEKESAEEETLEKENEKENQVKGRKIEKKRANRLEEINKLINSLKSTVDEDVNPLTKEDIENLLKDSKEESPGTKNGGGDAHCTPPPEVISELVSNAKLLMPKFKYRFDDS